MFSTTLSWERESESSIVDDDEKYLVPRNSLNNATEFVVLEQIGQIEQGKFIEERNVMCYIACVYSMTQVVSILGTPLHKYYLYTNIQNISLYYMFRRWA